MNGISAMSATNAPSERATVNTIALVTIPMVWPRAAKNPNAWGRPSWIRTIVVAGRMIRM